MKKLYEDSIQAKYDLDLIEEERAGQTCPWMRGNCDPLCIFYLKGRVSTISTEQGTRFVLIEPSCKLERLIDSILEKK